MCVFTCSQNIPTVVYKSNLVRVQIPTVVEYLKNENADERDPNSWVFEFLPTPSNGMQELDEDAFKTRRKRWRPAVETEMTKEQLQELHSMGEKLERQVYDLAKSAFENFTHTPPSCVPKICYEKPHFFQKRDHAPLIFLASFPGSGKLFVPSFPSYTGINI